MNWPWRKKKYDVAAECAAASATLEAAPLTGIQKHWVEVEAAEAQRLAYAQEERRQWLVTRIREIENSAPMQELEALRNELDPMRAYRLVVSTSLGMQMQQSFYDPQLMVALGATLGGYRA